MLTSIFAMIIQIKLFYKNANLSKLLYIQRPAPNVSVSYAPEDDFSEFTSLVSLSPLSLLSCSDDTFAQFYYQSRHMASPRPSPPSSRHVTQVASLPPEVVLGKWDKNHYFPFWLRQELK